MQFNLYIFNQLLRTTLALTSVLVNHLALSDNPYLRARGNRGAAVGEFLPMSITSMPLWLMIAIPISGFISVNWVFSRILADRELVVMQSIGLSPFHWLKPQSPRHHSDRVSCIHPLLCRHPSVFTRICSLNCVIAFHNSVRENILLRLLME